MKGSKSGYSTSLKDEDASSMLDTPSSPLDLKEMERSFELEIWESSPPSSLKWPHTSVHVISLPLVSSFGARKPAAIKKSRNYVKNVKSIWWSLMWPWLIRLILTPTCFNFLIRNMKNEKKRTYLFLHNLYFNRIDSQFNRIVDYFFFLSLLFPSILAISMFWLKNKMKKKRILTKKNTARYLNWDFHFQVLFKFYYSWKIGENKDYKENDQVNIVQIENSFGMVKKKGFYFEFNWTLCCIKISNMLKKVCQVWWMVLRSKDARQQQPRKLPESVKRTNLSEI